MVATAMCSPSRVPGLGADPATFTASSVAIQCRVWCQGVLGRTGCGSGGCGVCGGAATRALLAAVWKLTVSSRSRHSVPMLWWWVDSRVSVMAWVSVGWGLISMKVLWCWAAVVMACWNRTGWRTLSAQ